MTSELKPCPFCGRKPTLNHMGDGNYMARCSCLQGTGIYASKEKAAAKWNTRAVPAVPELVRYRPAVYMEPCLGGMFNDEFGEYVLHSQAAEIFAAKDAEIEQLKETLQEIANSYTAHGYRDAMDAFQQLRDIAKDALHGEY